MQYVTFYVSEIRYGLPIYALREISRTNGITPVQGASDNVEGLMNLRGQVIPVLNLGSCMDAGAIEASESSRLVIIKSESELSGDAVEMGIKTASENLALLVESIGEVVDRNDDEIEALPSHVNNGLLSGVIRLDKETLSILSSERLTDLNNNEVETDRDERIN